MESMRPGVRTINPREVLAKAGGMDVIAGLLGGTGYMVQAKLLREMAQAIKSGQPHLIEGPRGSGKTALAEALAESCNLPVFYLQGMEGLELKDVLYSWDESGQSQWVSQATGSGMDLKDARAAQWESDYLIFGEALGAYEYAARTRTVPILVIDEIDKLNERIEDMLLQLFGRGFAHVPRFGNVGVFEKELMPIVVLLSNDIRHDLSEPMRSRCTYSWLDMPTAREEVAILCARVPEAGPEMVACVAKLLDCVRDIPGVESKPALREGIAVLSAFVRDGVREVTEQVLTEYLCHIAKRHNDRDYLLNAMARVEMSVNDPHPEVDAWVAEEFRSRRPNLVAA